MPTSRANQLVTLGDRFFRAGNLKKAEERYQQAQRSRAEEAGPRVRLAQIAFVRGAYGEAASRLREALTVQPGWLVTAGDIQSLYGEPAEFAPTWHGSGRTFRLIPRTATPGLFLEPSFS